MPLLWSSQKCYRAFNPLPPHFTRIHLVLQGSREASREACFPSCCGLTLAGHLVLPDLSYHSSSQQNKRQRKYVEKKITGQNKDSLIKQRSHREAKDNENLTPYFPLAGMSSHFPGSRAAVLRVVAPEHKYHSKWHRALYRDWKFPQRKCFISYRT